MASFLDIRVWLLEFICNLVFEYWKFPGVGCAFLSVSLMFHFTDAHV
jgi:hypothetical protein